MAITATSTTLKTRVFEIADKKGLKLTWLAKRYGLRLEHLLRIRDGQQPISRKFVEKSCELFPEYTLSDLFFIENVSNITLKVT